MTTSPERDFDTWLDAWVAGRSTPASRAAANSTTAGVREAARQFHGLARQAEQATGPAGAASPGIPTWSAIMSAHAPAGPAPKTRAVPARIRLPRWQAAINVSTVFVLLVAIGVGAWRAWDRFGGGGDGEGDGNLAFAPETRTFEPEGTPAAAEDLPVIPTAAECTVEPLTVDEVLWYVENPGAAARGQTMESLSTPASTGVEPTQAPDAMIDDGVVAFPDGTAVFDPLVASPPAMYEPGPASADQLAAMASLQRQWMACVLADSPFQRWALESPELVAEQAQMLMPTFVTRDEARAILEEVERTGVLEPSEDFWNQPGASYQMLTSRGYPAGDIVAVIEADNAEAWTDDGRTFWVTYSWYQMDGTLQRDGNLSAMYTPESDEPTPVPGQNGEGGCQHFGITWFPDREELLISWYPHCG